MPSYSPLSFVTIWGFDYSVSTLGDERGPECRNESKILILFWLMTEDIQSFFIISRNKVPVHLFHFVHVEEIDLLNFAHAEQHVASDIDIFHQVLVFAGREVMQIGGFLFPPHDRMAFRQWIPGQTNIYPFILVDDRSGSRRNKRCVCHEKGIACLLAARFPPFVHDQQRTGHENRGVGSAGDADQ